MDSSNIVPTREPANFKRAIVIEHTIDDYFYIAIRTDLPLADQMCQVAHVATDAGRYFGVHEKCNLVLLQVKNREALFKLERMLTKNQIQHTMQVEHDDERKETALATGMVFGETRRLFRKYRIWTEPKMDWQIIQGPMMEIDTQQMIADMEADMGAVLSDVIDAEIVE